MLKVLLADDEPLAQDRLRRMLEMEKDFTVVGTACNGRQALQLVEQLQPDIILLDIRMPDMDGLETARHLTRLTQSPAIIFCTAFDEYAISAFEVNAIGYLLKPVRQKQLLAALERAKKISTLQWQKLSALVTPRKHLCSRSHRGIELLELAEISHFMANQKCVIAHYQGREIIVDESLKELEKELERSFLRIHRNCLVAIKWIRGLQRTSTGQGQILLKDLIEPLDVSRRHLAKAKRALEGQLN